MAAGTFQSIVAPTFGNNSSIIVNKGTLEFAATSGTATIGSGVTVTVAAGASLELAGSVSALGVTNGTLTGVANIVNNSQAAGGGLHVAGTGQQAGTITGTGNMTVDSGAKLTAYQIIQNSLTISGTGSVTLSPSGSGSITNPTGPNNTNFSSRLNSLSLANDNSHPGAIGNVYSATLDIGNNGLVIPYGGGADPYLSIDDMIHSAYANGVWTGAGGITSSLARAAANSASPLNIGLRDFRPGQNGAPTSIMFAGQTITTNAVLVRLTYMDDLILAGDMLQGNATTDALVFAANYGTGTTWGTGDLNHDGVINSGDALIFAANYAVGYPSLDGTTGNAAAFNPAPITGGAPVVPEPASLLLAAVGLLCYRILSRSKSPGKAATGL